MFFVSWKISEMGVNPLCRATLQLSGRVTSRIQFKENVSGREIFQL